MLISFSALVAPLELCLLPEELFLPELLLFVLLLFPEELPLFVCSGSGSGSPSTSVRFTGRT